MYILNAPITTKVKTTEVTPDVSSMLQTVWVKFYNWDPESRVEHIVREIAYMAGHPDMVDLQSLNKGGPVRIKVTVRDPELIRGETEVFFNIVGRKLTWVVENKEVNEVTMKISKYTKFDRHRDRDNEQEDDENRELNSEEHDPSFVAMAKEMKRNGKVQAGIQGTKTKTIM